MAQSSYGTITINDITDRGIVSTENWYKVSNNTSETFPIGNTGWTKCPPGTIPVPTANQKYLWFYEITTYSDGSISTRGPVVQGTYGDKGDQGDDGLKGTMTPVYYLDTSNTSTPIAPDGPIQSTQIDTDDVSDAWTYAIPTWSPGSYYWICYRTDYEDGTYTYGSVLLDNKDTYNAMNAYNAQANATSAVSTANSKPNITYSTSPPTPSDSGKAGDMWIVRNDNSHASTPTSTNGDIIYMWKAIDSTTGDNEWVIHLTGTTTIMQGSIATEQLAANAVTAGKIAANAIKIGSANILRGTSQMKSGSGGWSSGQWYKSGTGTTEFNQTVSDSPVANIKGCKMTSSGTDQIGFAQASVPIRTGEDMVFSVWVKAPSGTVVRLQPWWHNGVSVGVDGFGYEEFDCTGSWQYISTRFTKRTTTTASAGYVYFRGTAANQVCYAVAPMMEYGNFPSSWAPSPDDAGIAGATIINGGNIITGTIDASKATITNINASNITTGTLGANHIKLYSMMEIYESATGSIGGYIGYREGAWKPTSSSPTIETPGISLSSTDGSKYIIVTSSGVRMSTVISGTEYSVYLADRVFHINSPYAMIGGVNSPRLICPQLYYDFNVVSASTRTFTLDYTYVPCFGCITTSSTDAYIWAMLPKKASPLCTYTVGDSELADYDFQELTASIRGVPGGYLGGGNNADLVSLANSGDIEIRAVYLNDYGLRINMRKSGGWGFTNNTPIAGYFASLKISVVANRA